jgi:hypothetical protein
MSDATHLPVGRQRRRDGGKLGAGRLCDSSHVVYTGCGVPHMGVGFR